ncbi:MAG: MarR family winged helix-turn-helix transcriptional regulator [bacterium]
MDERSVVPISNRVENENMGFLVYEVARSFTNAYAKLMAPLGLTRPQARVIACVLRYPGITQADLCEYIGVGRMAMSGLIDRMESKDLVTRSTDPSDLRVKRVFLTRSARKLLPDLQSIADALYEQSMKSVKAKDLKVTMLVLSTIKENLGELLNDTEQPD